jgi:hypothetical protein
MEEQIVEMIRDDIKELKEDVKALLQFKWQIVGGSVAMSFIITVLFQMLTIIFNN